MSPVRCGEVHGHPSVTLENAHLRVTALPAKGADIYEIVSLPAGIDCLVKTPWGLQPPGAQPPGDFLDNYEGGWQELFPNANDACEYAGRAIPFHGEAALRPWTVVENDEEAPGLTLRADMRLLPFRLTKSLRLRAGAPVLEVAHTVENLGAEPAHFTWGQHLALGAPFLEDGCTVRAPDARLVSGDTLYEPETALLAPGQRAEWPFAAGRNGQAVDLRRVPGPEAHTHDDLFLVDLAAGWFSVVNERLGLAVDLEWDVSFYRAVALWMAYGGCDAPPLTGMYGLGVEPYVSRLPLAPAVAAGEARLLAPGAREETTLRLRFGPLLSGAR